MANYQNIAVQLQSTRTNPLLFIFFGVLLGVSSFFSFGATIALVGMLSILFFLRKSNDQDRRFLTFLFIVAVVSRILAVYFLHIFLSYQGVPEGDLFGDGWDNSLRSAVLVQYWLGNVPSDSGYTPFGYNMHGWTYFGALYYLFFGHSPLGLKFINSVLSAFTAIIIYFIAKELFGNTKVAKFSAVLVAFLPSMFLWSLSNLKDSAVFFLISIILWFFIKFQKKRKVYYLVFLILSLCFFATLRKGMGFTMIIALFLSYIFMSKLSVIKKISVCLAAVIVLQSFLAVKNKNLKSTISEKLAYIVSVHKGVVTTGGSVYKLLEDRHYLFNPKRTAQRPGAYFYSAADLNLGDYAKMFFKGWVHFLFEPFPWEIYTKKMLLSYPQVILWYILMPFAFLGMMLAARYNLSSFLLLFIYLFIIGSLLAMTGGNIGTVFRHRDMVMPIFIIFASAGLVFLFNINNLRITSK